MGWLRVSGQSLEDHECQARELELGCRLARLFEQTSCSSESGLVIRQSSLLWGNLGELYEK